jgi:hypothetical protein
MLFKFIVLEKSKKNKNYNSNNLKKFMMNGNKIAQKMRFRSI